MATSKRAAATSERGRVWVCSCCGKRSRDRRGYEKIDAGWDSSCTTHAVLCHDPPAIDASGRRDYVAVQIEN